MKKYTTVSGDTFDLIAKKTLSNEMLAEEIMKANSNLLDYVVFPAGIEVIIPEIKIQSINQNQPPWRKQK